MKTGNLYSYMDYFFFYFKSRETEKKINFYREGLTTDFMVYDTGFC